MVQICERMHQTSKENLHQELCWMTLCIQGAGGDDDDDNCDDSEGDEDDDYDDYDDYDDQEE